MKRNSKIKSDNQLEKLLDKDLSDYISKSNFQKVTFEFLPKEKKVNLRFSEKLLKAIKQKAKEASLPYQRYIRLILEEAIS